MNTLRAICHCGHHKDTHFEKKHACLGALCDCREYVSELEPKVEPAPITEPIPSSIGWGYHG